MDLKEQFEFQQELNGRSTPYENAIEKILQDNNIEYIKNYPISAGGTTYFVDFYLLDYNCYIEVDGRHHANDLMTIKHDRLRRRRIYNSKKWVEVRIKNWHVKNITWPDILQRIKQKRKDPLPSTISLARKVMMKKKKKYSWSGL